MPVPESAHCWGLAEALSEPLNVALRGPDANGLKTIGTLHDTPGARVGFRQVNPVTVTAKSAPAVSESVPKLTVELPMFVMMTDSAGEFGTTSSEGKERADV